MQHGLVERFPNVTVIDFREILLTVQDVMSKVTLAISIVGGLVLLLVVAAAALIGPAIFGRRSLGENADADPERDGGLDHHARELTRTHDADDREPVRRHDARPRSTASTAGPRASGCTAPSSCT